MIPHMTHTEITREITDGNDIFSNAYEAFYTALAKADSLTEAMELANEWGYNAAILNDSWFKALSVARENFLDF